MVLRDRLQRAALLKRGALAGAALLLAAGMACVAALTLFPFETSMAQRRFALWRVGARQVERAGLVAYERDNCLPGGACRCVALLHGLGDVNLTWDKVLLDPRAGRQGLRLLAPNMPGTDGSRPPADPSGYKIAAQAKAVRRALEQRCPEWTVVGNSLGGWIALALGLDWPEGVRELVLLNAAGVEDPTGQTESAAKMLGEPSVEKLKEFNRGARFVTREIPERAWRSALAAILARPTRAVVSVLDRTDLVDRRLRALKAKTTIIWGDADGIIPISVGERMHRLIRGARFVRVAGCAHLPQQECPEPVMRTLLGETR